ncbi:cadherin-like beta sandwich domain-containing protein [Paenibacillus sp. YIM B09110]|uniref:cadherin-like beta sandwich domain-containing protein n=1 Tax=Paenibacillus sp. YIM B09110 TaxID=3126102 RepID=UPI00301BD360
MSNRILSFIIALTLLLGLIPTAVTAAAAEPWELQTQLPTNDEINDVAFVNGAFMAVGTSGLIMNSKDGESWRNSPSGVTEHLNSVAYGNGTYVAVGTGGTIVTSPDGEKWTSAVSGTTLFLESVAYGNGLFVAVGGNRYEQLLILTSTNGKTWNVGLSSAAVSLLDVAYGNGLFVAVGNNGKIYTSPGGTTWTNLNLKEPSRLTDVAYGNGKFITIGSGKSAVSSDGISWTQQNASGAGTIMNLGYANGQYIATGGTYGAFNTSADGITWTASKIPDATGVIYAVAYGNGIYVAVGMSGLVATSADGLNWSVRSSTGGGTIQSVAYGNNAYVAVGTYGAILSSVNGGRWVARNPYKDLTSAQLLSVAYGNGTFVAVGELGTIVTSKDGVNWALASAGHTKKMRGITFSSGKFVAVGEKGSIQYSTDGLTWNQVVSNSAADLYSVTYGNGAFVAVGTATGRAEVVISNDDGITWSAKAFTNVYFLKGVAYGNGNFVAVGGAVITSIDGKTWSTIKVNQNYAAVAYGNGTYMAVSASEPAQASRDGVVWNSVGPVGSFDYSVAYGKGQFILASYGGAIRMYGNADLSGLSVSSGKLSPAFEPGTTSYEVNVPNDVSSITLTPAVMDVTSAVTVKNASPSQAVALGIGLTQIPIVVTAQDGTVKTYIVKVFRAAADASNPNLSQLQLSNATLNPPMSSNVINYTASVPNTSSSIKVVPYVTAAGGTVKVNDVAVASGTASGDIPLNVGVNKISILSTAPNGKTIRIYTVSVTRQAPADSNADLLGIHLDSGTLSSVFAPATTGYSVNVASGVSSMVVTPSLSDPRATVKVNDTVVANGSPSGAIRLNAGENVVTLTVTAYNRTTTKKYVLKITRATVGSNSLLSGLKLSNGAVSPVLAPGTLTYAAGVGSNVSTITITPTVAETGSKVTVNGTSVASGTASAPISLKYGLNVIAVKVTAANGTAKAYTFNITRNAATNANLSELSLDSGTLPAFNPSATNYATFVPNGVSKIRVTAATADNYATLSINGVTTLSGNPSALLDLAEGSNAIALKVTAPDGVTTKTYQLNITRATAEQSNARLSSLTLSSGYLGFAPNRLSYPPVIVDSAVSSITVTPTAAVAGSTIKVNGVPVASGKASGAIQLSYGQSTFIVDVVAPDGISTRRYEVVMNRDTSNSN